MRLMFAAQFPIVSASAHYAFPISTACAATVVKERAATIAQEEKIFISFAFIILTSYNVK